MINPVEAAKAIKAELKAKYPTRKFSVRSERFSMGNSVNVVCDEEILAQVRDLIEKYEYGAYDAMQDLAYSVHNPNLPQAKYVSAYVWSK
jgi:hypothetical protein